MIISKLKIKLNIKIIQRVHSLNPVLLRNYNLKFIKILFKIKNKYSYKFLFF